MKKNNIKQIEQKILDFLHRMVGQIPEFLKKIAETAIAIIDKAQEILASGGALLTQMFPQLEEYRLVIMNILSGLETAIKALAGIDQDYVKGLYFTAASKIAAVQHGNALKMNRYNLAVQNVYSARPESATVIA